VNNASSQPDHAYMAELCAGNVDAWAKLYERHNDLLVRFCGNFTNDLHLAQDVAHEAFIKLRENASQFRSGADLKPWLYKIARNLCLKEAKKKREVRWTDSTFAKTICSVVDSGPSPASKLANLHLNARALEILANLTEEQRTVVLLKYVEGLTRQEIAIAMDIPEATVKSRLYYAMNAIREKIGKGL
jgi:RNA polymerase sigma-70 factor, ECF subfamily